MSTGSAFLCALKLCKKQAGFLFTGDIIKKYLFVFYCVCPINHDTMDKKDMGPLIYLKTKSTICICHIQVSKLDNKWQHVTMVKRTSRNIIMIWIVEVWGKYCKGGVQHTDRSNIARIKHQEQVWPKLINGRNLQSNFNKCFA